MYSNISNKEDQRPYKDKLHNWKEIKQEVYKSDYDWNENNNLKQSFVSSGGFRVKSKE